MTGVRSGPLADVRIVDLTQALAGPFCTMLLADLGADVVKIEPPQGDMTRALPPFPADRAGCDYGGYFASINRNKRSVVLDLRQAGDRDILFRLVDRADAVVENARVGVMDRLGVGYEQLRERNPRLVYAAIRGFGDPRTGPSPYADWPAFDIVAQCMGGIVGTTGRAGTSGVPCGASVGDLFPGTLAALGVVSAIHAARVAGVGQFLDVAMYDALVSLCEGIIYNFSYAGRVVGPRGTGHLSLCPFDVFETRDGGAGGGGGDGTPEGKPGEAPRRGGGPPRARPGPPLRQQREGGGGGRRGPRPDRGLDRAPQKGGDQGSARGARPRRSGEHRGG